ncbi:MAG TPA: hypothetical protein VG871_16965 [Vicinamibacterales bacterium]|nr:hypothetical protein [Vicinamibacterales bacterium]
MRATVLLLMMLLVAPVVARASDRPQPAVDISGTYLCQGQSPDGTSYHGIVQIVKIDDTFRIRWALAGRSGEVDLVGVGIYSNGVFAVSYFGGAPGVGVYKLEGANLDGEWTIGGADGAVYSETLTRMQKPPDDSAAPGNSNTPDDAQPTEAPEDAQPGPADAVGRIHI